VRTQTDLFSLNRNDWYDTPMNTSFTSRRFNAMVAIPAAAASGAGGSNHNRCAGAAAVLPIRAQGIVVRQPAAAYLALIERRERLYLFIQHAAERWLVFL
jgi:hypothetical protein